MCSLLSAVKRHQESPREPPVVGSGGPRSKGVSLWVPRHHSRAFPQALPSLLWLLHPDLKMATKSATSWVAASDVLGLARRNLPSSGVTAGISTLFLKMTIEKYL